MGDQPVAISELVSGVNDGRRSQVLLGVTGSGKTFTMANVIAELGRPALIMAPNKILAAQLYTEMKSFFPNNHVEYFVSYYDYYQPEAYMPTTDTYIDKDASINEQLDRMRHSATRAMLEERDVIVVSSVSSIYGMGSPEQYAGMKLVLRVGDNISMRDVMHALVNVSNSQISSISSPKNDNFHALSWACDGNKSSVSPRTRNSPRSNAVSLRLY